MLKFITAIADHWCGVLHHAAWRGSIWSYLVKRRLRDTDPAQSNRDFSSRNGGNRSGSATNLRRQFLHHRTNRSRMPFDRDAMLPSIGGREVVDGVVGLISGKLLTHRREAR